MNALFSRLAQLTPPPGSFALIPLGQHSFLLKLGKVTLGLDLYLTPDPTRLVAPPFPPEEAVSLDLILGSHDHGDHIDRPALPVLAKASPEAVLVVPEAVRRTVPFPPERVRGLDDGESVTLAGVRITAFAAAHELLERDPATGCHPCLGYVIEGNGVTVCHTGDCCIYEGLQTKLSRWRFDLLLLPINGRDAERLRRNCIGNMTFQEAADLAGALRPALTMPAHFDMFAMNREDPRRFIDYMAVKYPHLKTRIPVPGELFTRF